SGRIERVVGAAVSHLDDLGDNLFARHALGIEEVRHAEFAAPFLACGVDVDADDPVSADEFGTLDYVEPDSAEAEDDDVAAGLDLRRIHDGADAGGDAAADVAAGLERRIFADLRNGDFGQHGEVRE